MRSINLLLLGGLGLILGACAGLHSDSVSAPPEGIAALAARVDSTGVPGDETPQEGRSSGLTTVEDLINEDIDASIITVSDPFQPVNRLVYHFNDGLYTYLLKPASTVYAAVMPDPVERGVSNVFTNLRYPKRFAGNLLQGKVDGAAKETGKFLVNSTLGVGGLMRASDQFESLSTPSEDLGQAFGKWGLGPGPYVVLPVAGPNTLRGTVGMVGDGFLDPLVYVGPTSYRLAARGLEHLNDSPELMADYQALKEGSIDPYLALRDAYVQSREQMVTR